MSRTSRLVGPLLLSSALTVPGIAYAQTNTTPPTTNADASAVLPEDGTPPDAEEVEISIPGGSEIVVTGARDRNIERASNQVVSILSSEQIAKTGEGDIAGALGRVTGLSVVGNGFVYVRGLGDRYSLALLNGSPLPSPEPLKRVVPLDLFPTDVIASALVQKSYSVNFPGEFGGGVINLTTKATPDEPFLAISGGISGDTITTFSNGLSYYGSSTDWTGYDNGNRDIPPALDAFFSSGERLSAGTTNTTAIARQIVTGRNSVVQRIKDIPANYSINLSAGKTWDVGSDRFGVILAAGYQNSWRTKQPLQQTSLNAQLEQLETDFTTTVTDQRLVLNGLFGVGYEFGDNRVRWTNLYIHDTDKQAALGIGQRNQTTADFLQQRTGFYERQLINSQIVGEFKVTPDFNVDVRGGYANSKRKAPFELAFEYTRTNSDADPYGQVFVNRLNNGNGGNGQATFSDLDEDVWSGGIDFNYRFAEGYRASIGGTYIDTQRTSSRRDFLFLAPNNYQGDTNVITAIGLLRPDLLVNALTSIPQGNGAIDPIGITIIETDEGNPAYAGLLRNYAGYAKIDAQLTDALSADIGVRYEHARQTVDPIQVFSTPGASGASTDLNRGYFLPAGTITLQIQPQLQLRINGSKTIARPQFRELISQPFYDPDTNRPYRGNPLLVDSQLYNAEARLEYYFAPEQRISIAGFYKRLDNPIEAYVAGLDITTSYANAPKANLYGGELDVVKYFDLRSFGSGFFASRRLATTVNYTFTKSRLLVRDDDTVQVFGAFSTNATDFFRDGAPLTGQSNHIANLEIGLENTDRLSQQTFLISYASERVISRGLNGTPPQPDVIEKPGVQLDFVWREGFTVLNTAFEAKLQARNILGRKHEEFQQFGDNRIDVNTYEVGTTLAASLGVRF